MKNKKQLIYLIIFLAVFLVAIIGATYAYFESATDLNGAEFNVQAITAGATTFTGYSTGTIEVEANSTSMTEANVSTNVVDHDNATVTVKVDSENGNALTTCTYDLVWVWDSEETYTTPDIGLPYTHTDGKVYPYELSVKIDDGEEKDLSSFTWNGKETVIANKSITSNDNELTYSIDVQIYNIPVVQTKLFNKQLQAHIEIRNNVCISVRSLASHLKSLYQGQGTSVGDGVLYLHDSTLENSAGDNSYRYAGANPDNYVCFEGDDCTDEDNLYRIIGVFNNQVKLIKHKHIGKMAWNNNDGVNSTNTWEGSSLEQYLNNTENGYLASLGDKVNLIADTTWSVGGHNDSDITVKVMHDVETNNSTTITRKIGLMYLSEYGYATINTNWTTSLWDYDIDEITTTNWLYDSANYQWTISRNSVFTDNVLYVFIFGSVGFNPVSGLSAGARPVFYLLSTAQIVDGNGSQGDPFVVS